MDPMKMFLQLGVLKELMNYQEIKFSLKDQISTGEQGNLTADDILHLYMKQMKQH